MKSDWQHLSLRDAGISLIDCVHKTPEAKDEGFPYVAIPQMKDGRIDLNSTRKISHEDLLAWTVKAKPEAYDIVLSRRCNPGESAYVPEGVEFALGQNLVLLRSDGKKVYKPYLRWLLNSPFWWAEVNKYMNVGAVFTSLKCADVPNFTLPIPPLDEQIKISDILSSLDNKIELNRQINQTLESMAQAIFKSWFVDFEPVKAKISALKSGEDAEGVTCAAMRAISGKTDDELDKMEGGQPEDYAKLKTTAELFPAAMQDSELGEVPEGWNWKRADEICDISIGKTPPRKEPQWFSSFPDGLKWVSIRDMGECGVFALDTSETLTHDAVKKFNVKKIPDNTLILSFKLTVGRVAITSGEMLTNEAIAHFIQKSEINIPTSFYYLYLKQFDYNSLGSTSSIATAVNSKTIKALPIIMPLEDVIGRFDALIEPLFSQIKLVEEQNRDLSNLRDTLLPKLMSGTIRTKMVV
jgi:type I restriction enzyme S subunit